MTARNENHVTESIPVNQLLQNPGSGFREVPVAVRHDEPTLGYTLGTHLYHAVMVRPVQCEREHTVKGTFRPTQQQLDEICDQMEKASFDDCENFVEY